MQVTEINNRCLASTYIKQAALKVGFDACGIAEARSLGEVEFGLNDWLLQGLHANMHFMEEHRDMRHDPSMLVPEAKSVISVLVGYKPSQTISGDVKIAQYAYGEDYHERLKRMLYQLFAAIREDYPDFEARPFVDTAPISDKLWAARAGLGWIGRNTLLITPEFGSYCFIGELVTAYETDRYDTPMPNGCGECNRCVEACPNGAISRIGEQNHTAIISQKCNAYNTIENREEHLPKELNLAGYAFGCDCCQLVCPYNIKAKTRYMLTDEHKQHLESLPESDEATFKKASRHSALNRIKYAQWQRNIMKVKN